jgi:hypothetical protein
VAQQPDVLRTWLRKAATKKNGEGFDTKNLSTGADTDFEAQIGEN